MSNPTPRDFTAMVNARLGGFDKLIGLHYVRVALDEVVAEVPVVPQLHQPYGLVHGGVYATIIEAMCSTGAAVHALPKGLAPVGVENATSFLRAVREGTLHARAVPVSIGRRTQVWSADVKDDAGRVVATGRVRVLTLERGSKVAGGDVDVAE